MKSILIVLFSAVSVLAQSPLLPFLGARAIPTDYSLKAYWRMDEGSGTSVADSSGNLHPGELSGTYTWTSGIISNCVQFTSGRMVATNSIAFGLSIPGGFTPTGLSWDSASNYFLVGDFTSNRLVSLDTNGGFITAITVYSNLAGGIQGVAYDPSDDTFWYVGYLGTNVNHVQRNGTWIGSFVSAQCNGLCYNQAADTLYVLDGGQTVNVYNASNGSFASTFTLTGVTSGDGITIDPSDGTLWVTQDPNTMFHLTSSGGAITSFPAVNGNIEHPAIFNQMIAITTDQTYHTPAIHDGNRIFIVSKTGNPIDAPVVSLSAWIYPTTISGNHIIMENYHSATEGVPAFGIFYRSTGACAFFCGPSTLESSVGSITLSNWQHIVLTYDGLSGVLKGYRNASQLVSRTNTMGTYVMDATNYVAARGATTLPIIGRVDDVRIYKRTLPASEISLIYQAGTNGLSYP